jgi:hypothetical protein
MRSGLRKEFERINLVSDDTRNLQMKRIGTKIDRRESGIDRHAMRRLRIRFRLGIRPEHNRATLRFLDKDRLRQDGRDCLKHAVAVTLAPTGKTSSLSMR